MFSYLRLALTLAFLTLAFPVFAQGYCPSGTPYNKLITGTSYTIGQADYCLVDTFTSGSAIAVTLPAPGSGGGFLTGFEVAVFAEGAGAVTVTPSAPFSGSTPTINGGSSLVIGAGKSSRITVGTDGNYYATSGGGSVGTLTVANGGTGATTFTAHGVLLGEGTSAITPTAAMTNGQLLVGATGADPAPQTLSGDVGSLTAGGALTLSKVNTVTYPATFTSGGIPYASAAGAISSSAALAVNGVVIGGGAGATPATITAGTAGQLLVGSAGAPSFVTPASALTKPANPSAVSPGTSTAQALGMGTGTGAATLTPTATGRVYYTFSFTVAIANTTNGATFQCSHGTGTAPANAATTGLGTADSAAVAYLAGATTEKAVVTCAGTLTGLTLSTAVWFDVIVLNTTGSQAVTVTVPTFNAFEF